MIRFYGEKTLLTSNGQEVSFIASQNDKEKKEKGLKAIAELKRAIIRHSTKCYLLKNIVRAIFTNEAITIASQAFQDHNFANPSANPSIVTENAQPTL